jgi:hypothetical protein
MAPREANDVPRQLVSDQLVSSSQDSVRVAARLAIGEQVRTLERYLVVTYRNDLDAAHTRVDALEREVAELRDRNEKLAARVVRPVVMQPIAAPVERPVAECVHSFDEDGRLIDPTIDRSHGRREALHGLAIMGGGLLLGVIGVATSVAVFNVLGLAVFIGGVWYGSK